MAKMYVHINKFELKKLSAGKKGKPWTIHTGGKCIRATDVKIIGEASAECYPDRPTNPKCFIVVHGTLKKIKGGKFEIISDAKPRTKLASARAPGVMSQSLLRKATTGFNESFKPKKR